MKPVLSLVTLYMTCEEMLSTGWGQINEVSIVQDYRNIIKISCVPLAVIIHVNRVILGVANITAIECISLLAKKKKKNQQLTTP